MKNLHRLSAIIAAVLLLSTTASQAAGLAILEQSIPGLGRSMAGMTASTDDPSGLYYNPATAAWADHAVVMAGCHWLTGDVEFEPNRNGLTSKGPKGGDFIRQTFIPNLDLTLPLNEIFNFNLATSATSGTSVHYNRDWVGRYLAVDNDMAVAEIQPSISWKMTDNFAVAAGLLIDYCQIKVQQYIPTKAMGLSRDVWMSTEGNTWSFGFTAGAVWRPFDGTSVGFGYRSKTRNNIRMRAKFTNMPEELGMGEQYVDWGNTTIEMPDAFNFGVQQAITERFTLMADASYTRWSCMKEMKMTFDHGLQGIKESTEKMNWHDSWRFALGGEYKLTEKWTLRAGGAFDQRAVSKQEDKTFKLPDSHRYWLSCGASYQWNEHLRIDAAFCHIFFHPSKIDNTDAIGQRLYGKVCGYTNLLSLGVRYDF